MSNYGFGNLDDYKITPDVILSKVSDTILWRYYLGCNFRVGESIKAPYRVDNSPSMSFFYDSTQHKICAKDHGKGRFSGDVFDYVMMVFGLDFYSALVKVNLDFDLGLTYSSDKYKGAVRKSIVPNFAELKEFEKKHDNTVYSGIKPVFRLFTPADIAYWNQYGISSSTLFKYNVRAVQGLKINGQTSYRYDLRNTGNPCYMYLFPVTRYRLVQRAKCYWPNAPQGSKRFIGNANNRSDVQGYDQCSIATKKEGEKGELLILTKSLKDCMLLHEYGIEAMAPHGESQLFTNDFIAHLKRYYKVIISLYDRDETGVKGAKRLWKDHAIAPYLINKRYKCKDLTDLYKQHGKKETTKVIKQLQHSYETYYSNQ